MWDNHRLLRGVANLLLLASILTLLVAGAQWVVRSGLLPIRAVHIRSKLTHVTQEQLRYVAEHELKGSFLTVDITETRAAFEKLPWVRKVSVRRSWPDRLEIDVEEHQAAARWAENGLVNTYGEWFDAAFSQPLPLLAGPKGSEKEMLAAYLAFKQVLQPVGVLPEELKLSARRAWQVKLDNSVVLELGRQDIGLRVCAVATSRCGVAQTGAGKWRSSAKRGITCQCRCGTTLPRLARLILSGRSTSRSMASTCSTVFSR